MKLCALCQQINTSSYKVCYRCRNQYAIKAIEKEIKSSGQNTKNGKKNGKKNEQTSNSRKGQTIESKVRNEKDTGINMPLAWKPLTQETYQSWIDAIIAEASDELSDWESEFVESVNTYLARKGILTEKQAKILERIYAEKTK